MQRIHPCGPEVSVRREPGIDLGEVLCTQPIDAALRLAAHLDEAGLAKDSKVPRDSRPRDGQQRGKFTRGRLAGTERIENRSSPPVGEGMQYSIHEGERTRMGT